MITVASVFKSGGDYDEHYVERLAAAVHDNLSLPHRFICLTDVPPIRFRRSTTVDGIVPLNRNWPGWWSKIELFTLRGPLLYIDLDTVLVGEIDDLTQRTMELDEKELLMLRGFYRNDRCSGILGWSGDFRWIFEDFIKHYASRATWRTRPNAVWMLVKGVPRSDYRGDQEWLSEFLSKKDDRVSIVMIQDVFSGIYSYKVHLRKQNSLPEDARVVCFHGSPRPHEVRPVPKWLKESWTSQDRSSGRTTPRQLRRMQLRGELTDYPHRHSGTLLIIGGSSTALKELERAQKYRPDAMIMAVGHAAGTLKVDFVVSDHYEVHAELKKLQNQFGEGHYSTHCSLNFSAVSISRYSHVDYWWNWPRAEASSVQTAIRIGLSTGFEEIVLCGCPLEHGRIQHPCQRRKDGDSWPPPRDIRRYGSKTGMNTSKEILDSFRKKFQELSPSWKGKVFSMSGFTRDVLGPPPWASSKDDPRIKTIRQWRGPQGVQNVYPAEGGRWPDKDSVEILQELCEGYVCDVGCGTGRCAEAFRSEDYIGLDINDEALIVARRTYPNHRFSSILWTDLYPKADTYLFYTMLLHIPDEELSYVLRKTMENGISNNIVIFESMDKSLRNEELGNYQRDVDFYIKTLTTIGRTLKEHRRLASKTSPFFRDFLVMR